MINTLLFLYFFYYILSIYYFEGLKGKNRHLWGVVICSLIAIIIGIREPEMWSDSAVYYQEFLDNVKALGELTPFDGPEHYSEMGFYYLGVISKTISSNSTFYFVFVSVITMVILYFAISRYSVFPFIALYIYLGRFINRNTIQIRAAIAIAIIIWGTVYVTKRQLWKYLLVVFVASRFHTSAFIALPLYFINYFNIKRTGIYIGLFLSFVIAQFYGSFINNLVSQSDIANEWASSYIQEGSEKAWSNDITNPMIWYQSFILIIWTYYEDKLSVKMEHYYTIRNAYFYSTILLIILCQYAILAGRLSTIFATYEFIMVPLIVWRVFKGSSWFVITLGALYGIFFYININGFL